MISYYQGMLKIMVAEVLDNKDYREDGDIPLYSAALCGDWPKLKDLIQDIEDPNILNVHCGPFGATPLRLAVTGGNVECVQELLKHGAEIDLVDIKAQTPLFVAVHNSHIECCKVLLAAGANPNGDPRNCVQPLHTACQNGLFAAVQLLLQHGADIENVAVTHPLHVTATYCHLDCFILLLLYGARTDLSQYAAGQPSIVPILMKKSIQPLFLELWVLFGGSLWHTDQMGHRVIVDVNAGPNIELLNRFKMTPLSLQHQCRIQIWKQLQRCVIFQLPLLGLPKSLTNFLAYKDIPEVCYLVDVITKS